jgi:nucleoside-diphosphate-sugar epimerase
MENRNKIGKVLLIGGSGFVGSRLAELLRSDCDLSILDKNPSPVRPEITRIGDVRKPESIDPALKDVATVVLLAAEHRDDVTPISLYYDVNVQGTRNVLDAMDRNGIRNILFVSSVSVYGLNKNNPDEQHPADPFNDYGKSKWQAEEVLREWYSKNPEGRTLTILRPTVIFGEGNRGNVYNLLRQIASGRFLMVGRGNNVKSMCYVGNVAAFIRHLLENGKGYEVYNYVDKPDFDMNALVDQVEKSLGRKLPAIRVPFFLGMAGGYAFDALAWLTRRRFAISSVRVKKFCATTQINADKALTTGFKAPCSIMEGLHNTIRYEFADNRIGAKSRE